MLFLLDFKWSDVFNNKTTSQLSQTYIRCSARERHMRSSRPCTSFALFSLLFICRGKPRWAELDPIRVGAEIIKLFPLVGGRLHSTRARRRPPSLSPLFCVIRQVHASLFTCGPTCQFTV